MSAPLVDAEERAKELGRAIKGLMPEGWGFVLVLAEFGAREGCTFLSSIQREGSVKLLRETADTIEQQKYNPPIVGQN